MPCQLLVLCSTCPTFPGLELKASSATCQSCPSSWSSHFYNKSVPVAEMFLEQLTSLTFFFLGILSWNFTIVFLSLKQILDSKFKCQSWIWWEWLRVPFLRYGWGRRIPNSRLVGVTKSKLVLKTKKKVRSWQRWMKKRKRNNS